MHNEYLPDDVAGHRRMKATSPQGDGRKPIPHILTAIITLALTVGLAQFTGVTKGQQGPSGTTTVITKEAQDYGVCAYFGKDRSGKSRFQLASPGASGLCARGTFVSVTPGR